jgi:polyisoprenoid-binding protein YceI
MKKIALVLVSLTIFLAACEDPSANKPKAQTAEPSNVSAANNSASTLTAAANSLPINPDNSKIEFTGSKVTGSHEGGFTKFSGSIDLVNDKPENSKVSVEIETASIYANVDQLTNHLKTPDFFDVEKFPKATFNSTKIVRDSNGGPDAYTVTGDFDLHGVRKSITYPAAIQVSPDDVTVKSEFSINRKDFGIMYAGKADDLVRDGVVIRLDIKAPKKK